MCTLVCQTASWILCCLCLRFLVFAWTHNDSRAQVCFICVAVTRLCLTVSDMRHVWCWHREYGTDWFTQGRCEAPGIHVDSFCPDIMHPPRLQSSHCTYCMSLAKKKKVTGSDQIRQLFSLMSPSWWFLFSTCFTVTTEYMTHESNEASFAFDGSTHTDGMELITKDYIFVTNSKINSRHQKQQLIKTLSP